VNIRFLTLAQQEVDEAVVWFDERVEGKGVSFLDELDRVVRLVKAFPLASSEILSVSGRADMITRFSGFTCQSCESSNPVSFKIRARHDAMMDFAR
jgi:hypothetical protein